MTSQNQDIYIWKLLDEYVKTNKNFLTMNQLDSFNTFISKHIPKTIKQFNPINLTQSGGAGENEYLRYINSTGTETKYKLEILVNIGGNINAVDKSVKVLNDGSNITVGKPILSEKTSSGEIINKQLFPNEARLRNLTYSSMIYSDVILEMSRISINDDITEDVPILLSEYIEDLNDISINSDSNTKSDDTDEPA